MSGCDQSVGTEPMITHPVDFETCYVMQRGRIVVAVKARELEAQQAFVPPKEWGDSWVRNVLEDGSGIYFRRA